MGFTPFGTSQTITGSLTVTGATTLQDGIIAGSSPGGPLPELVATTGVAGVALVNGTQTILTWTPPNDGAMHRVTLGFSEHVASLLTGGSIVLNAAAPDGTARAWAVRPGGEAAGVQGNNSPGVFTVPPNTPVTLIQNSAATAGAATVFAELWGS